MCTAIRLSHPVPPRANEPGGAGDVLCKAVQCGGDVAAAAVATTGGGEQCRLGKPTDKHGGASKVPVTGGCGGARRSVRHAGGARRSGRHAGSAQGGQRAAGGRHGRRASDMKW